MTWDTVNVLTISWAGKTVWKLAGKILNVFEIVMHPAFFALLTHSLSTFIPPLFQDPSFLKSRSNKGTKAKTTVVLMIQETRYYCYKWTTRLLIVVTVPVPDVVFIVAHPPIVVLLDQPTDEDVGYPFCLTHLQLGPQPLLHD